MNDLVLITYDRLSLSVLPLLLLGVLSWKLDLGVSSIIGISVVRTFIQLMALGFILVPVFHIGEEHPSVVLLYVFFMVILAAYESIGRTKYAFKGMFTAVAATYVLNLGMVSVLTFVVLLQPKPLWNPQYVIPMCGMLLGNCISGVSLSLNNLLTSLVEQRGEVELMLAFGASSKEATSRFIIDAIKSGMMPTFNTMAVIGLVSIPGMMTGQILGGSSPEEAAKYQMLIMYLIAATTFGSIITVFFVVFKIAFDKDGCLRQERFTKRPAANTDILRRLLDFLLYLWTCCTATNEGYSTISGENLEQGTEKPIRFHVLSSSSRVDRAPDYLKIESMTRVIGKRILFHDISLNVAHGAVCTVMGPSGAGKSQFMRCVAGLVPVESGSLFLNSKNRLNFETMSHWRRKVRYVPQTKVDIPGKPANFLEKFASFHVVTSLASPPLVEMFHTVKTLIESWDMRSDLIQKDWQDLSGGEAQRIIVAIALASRPKVLLLDEATSALDMETKMKVEKSVMEAASLYDMTVLWITHDEDQVERLESS